MNDKEQKIHELNNNYENAFIDEFWFWSQSVYDKHGEKEDLLLKEYGEIINKVLHTAFQIATSPRGKAMQEAYEEDLKELERS